MATKRQKVEVGIFLATAVAILTLILLLVAGVRRTHLEPYYLEFAENVAGLSEGSKVTYLGVPVGKILDLVVTPENRVGVTIGINFAKVHLREGVIARYSMVSIFGPYVVDLTGGTDQSAPLLRPGSTIPVHRSVLSGLEETVAETVPLTLQRATKLIDRFESILSKVKPDDLPAILRRAEEVLTHANEAVEDTHARVNEVAASVDKAVRSAHAGIETLSTKAGASLDEVREATGQGSRFFDSLRATIEENRKPLAESLKRLDAALAHANKQLEGLDLPAATASLRESAKKIGDAADGVGAAAKDVGSAAVAVARSRDDLRRTLENLERSLVTTLEELDRTLESARDLLDTLERDPSAILRGKRE